MTRPTARRREPPEIDHWKNLKDYVLATAQGYNQSLFVIGEGGIGKTETVLRTLRDNNQPYAHFKTFSTPLELYSYLYNHREDLVVMDDMEGILDNKKSVSILKSCLWGYEGRREVQYLSSTDRLLVPPRFDFNGKTIILLNEFPKNKFVQSLITRSVYYEVKIPFQDKVLMMAEIAMQPYMDVPLETRLEVFQYIRGLATPATTEFNFRTLIKAFNIRRYSPERWKDLVRLTLQPDEDLATMQMINTTMGDLTVLQQARLWMTETGKSRSTFFRLKKRMAQ